MNEVLRRYGFAEDTYTITPHGTGLINHTWLVRDKMLGKTYILQKINSKIFKSPENIACNIKLIADYLKLNKPGYLFEAPLVASDGNDMVVLNGEYYRMFRFVEKSHTIDVVENEDQAYEAASQFGKFTSMLKDFDASRLRITLPDFHNLPLRYQQFKMALDQGNEARILEAKQSIKFLLENESIVKSLDGAGLRLHVAHHDTKISNVLLDERDKGLCIIDLDTIMPGFFISDLGDMMRTYLSPVSEEESDFSKINIRIGYFKSIIEGYMNAGMDQVLDSAEKQMMTYSGKFMIYMQALRFITDYLNNDIYYGARYEKQNFIRGQNQIVLLEEYLKHEKEMDLICKKYC